MENSETRYGISNVEIEDIINILELFLLEGYNIIFGITDGCFEFVTSDKCIASGYFYFKAEEFINKRRLVENIPIISFPYKGDMIWFNANDRESIKKAIQIENFFFAVIRKVNHTTNDYLIKCIETIDGEYDLIISIDIDYIEDFNKNILYKLTKICDIY